MVPRRRVVSEPSWKTGREQNDLWEWGGEMGEDRTGTLLVGDASNPYHKDLRKLYRGSDI